MWTPFSPLARLGWKWVLFLPLRLVMKPPPLCPLPVCSNLLLSCKLDFQPSLSQAPPHLYTGGLGPGQIISHCLHVCYLGGTSDGQVLLMLTWLHLALFFIYIYLLR